MAKKKRKPRLAVFKLTSCDGCQLSLLDLEDELLVLAETVEIAHFTEASSTTKKGPYDLTLVEGSVTTPEHLERIQEIRAASRALVTIGACATAGGIQALRNGRNMKEFIAAVYASPEHIATLDRSTPVAEHVRVDFELRGCPIDRRQLLEVITAFLAGRRPTTPAHAVCVECKLAGHVCVVVAHGTPCLGPVTHAGCGALCPRHARGCYGCFGPGETTNTGALARRWTSLGASEADVARAFATFNAAAPAFRAESEAHGG